MSPPRWAPTFNYIQICIQQDIRLFSITNNKNWNKSANLDIGAWTEILNKFSGRYLPTANFPNSISIKSSSSIFFQGLLCNTCSSKTTWQTRHQSRPTFEQFRKQFSFPHSFPKHYCLAIWQETFNENTKSFNNFFVLFVCFAFKYLWIQKFINMNSNQTPPSMYVLNLKTKILSVMMT